MVTNQGDGEIFKGYSREGDGLDRKAFDKYQWFQGYTIVWGSVIQRDKLV